MLCLGIETSCDETACALLEDGKLTGEALASQIEVHGFFGGVVPELASREHYRLLGLLYDHLFVQTGVRSQDLDLIAVARGPGLLGSLLVGVSFAKGLALALDKPVIGVNHLHAHALAPGLHANLNFPALALVVSGGHTHIYRVESPARFMLLGRSIDDAAGEVFDKVGNYIGLAYPAGKEIDRLAQTGVGTIPKLPRPYLDNENLDFSFSGLKTAACSLFDTLPDLSGKNGSTLQDFCREFNAAIADTLVEKLSRALKLNPDVRELWLSGGVAANTLIRKSISGFAAKAGIDLKLPEFGLCTDNAAMIAHAGWLKYKEGIEDGLDFAAIPRGRKMPDDLACQIDRS